MNKSHTNGRSAYMYLIDWEKPSIFGYASLT